MKRGSGKWNQRILEKRRREEGRSSLGVELSRFEAGSRQKLISFIYLLRSLTKLTGSIRIGSRMEDPAVHRPASFATQANALFRKNLVFQVLFPSSTSMRFLMFFDLVEWWELTDNRVIVISLFLRNRFLFLKCFFFKIHYFGNMLDLVFFPLVLVCK